MAAFSRLSIAITLGASLAAIVGVGIALSLAPVVGEGGATIVGVLGAAGIGLGAGAVARLAQRRRFERLADELTRAVDGHGPMSELRPLDERRIAAAVNRLLDARRGERASEEADRRLLSSLIGGSPNGVLVVGRDGRVRFVNRAFRDLFDVRLDAVGRRPAEVVHVPEVLDLLDLAGNQPSEDEVVTATGARDVALRPIVTESGEAAIFAQDITRFRAAERARTAFVANVSHELRTPMAAILGYTDELTAVSADLPEQHRKLVDAVARNGRRLRDTFEGLMHLARVEARSGQLRLETLRLAPLLAEAVATASDLAASRGVGFELRCDEEVRAATNADAFDVIMNNLAANAVKYTPPGGRVIVLGGLVDGEVQIAVRDDGIGIDPAHHDRIFERFFRVDDGRAREVGGTGLGLAMVKHLCLATGARIAVRSAVGRGSTFLLTLAPPGPDAPDEGEE